jgi:hypothetical protein
MLVEQQHGTRRARLGFQQDTQAHTSCIAARSPTFTSFSFMIIFDRSFLVEGFIA